MRGLLLDVALAGVGEEQLHRELVGDLLHGQLDLRVRVGHGVGDLERLGQLAAERIAAGFFAQAGKEASQAVGHLVESSAQRPDLVVAGDRGARVEVAARDGNCGRADSAQRAHDEPAECPRQTEEQEDRDRPDREDLETSRTRRGRGAMFGTRRRLLQLPREVIHRVEVPRGDDVERTQLRGVGRVGSDTRNQALRGFDVPGQLRPLRPELGLQLAVESTGNGGREVEPERVDRAGQLAPRIGGSEVSRRLGGHNRLGDGGSDVVAIRGDSRERELDVGDQDVVALRDVHRRHAAQPREPDDRGENGRGEHDSHQAGPHRVPDVARDHGRGLLSAGARRIRGRNQIGIRGQGARHPRPKRPIRLYRPAPGGL